VRAKRRQEPLHVRIVPNEPPVLPHQGVHRARSPGQIRNRVHQSHHRFLVGDGDGQPGHGQGAHSLDKGLQPLRRGGKSHVGGLDPQALKPPIVQERRQSVPQGVADDAEEALRNERGSR
jgi:hypothetical protein